MIVGMLKATVLRWLPGRAKASPYSTSGAVGRGLLAGEEAEEEEKGGDYEDEDNEYEAEVVEQAQALIPHNGAIVADEQDGDDEERGHNAGDDVCPENQLYGVDTKEGDGDAHDNGDR